MRFWARAFTGWSWVLLTRIRWWLALNAGFVAAIVALLVIPTAVVSTVKPEETIRYE